MLRITFGCSFNKDLKVLLTPPSSEKKSNALEAAWGPESYASKWPYASRMASWTWCLFLIALSYFATSLTALLKHLSESATADLTSTNGEGDLATASTTWKAPALMKNGLTWSTSNMRTYSKTVSRFLSGWAFFAMSSVEYFVMFSKSVFTASSVTRPLALVNAGMISTRARISDALFPLTCIRMRGKNGAMTCRAAEDCAASSAMVDKGDGASASSSCAVSSSVSTSLGTPKSSVGSTAGSPSLSNQ